MKKSVVEELSALRRKVVSLEKGCKEREDKLTKLLFLLEPYVNSMSKEQQDKLLEDMGEM